MKKSLWGLGLVLLIGQTSVDAEGLMAIYQTALQKDAQLKSAEAAWRAAQELKPQARSYLLPSADLSTSISQTATDMHTFVGTGADDTFFQGQTALRLSQNVFNYEILANLRKSDHDWTAAEARYNRSKQDLMGRVATTYFNALLAIDTLRVARTEREAMSRHLDQANKRFEVGMAAKTEVYEAQARHDLARSQELQAENQLTDQLASLREITGDTYQKLALLGENLPLDPPDPSNLEHWVGLALKNNPQIIEIAATAESTRESIEQARAGYYPSVGLSLSHTRTDGGTDLNPLSPEEQTITSLNLGLNYNFYQGGRTSSVLRARQADFSRMQEELDRTRRSVEVMAQKSFRGILSSIDRIKALKQAVISTQSALEATRAGFEVGTRTFVDVLDAETNLHRAERDYATTRYNFLIGKVQLKQVSGVIAQEDLAGIDRFLVESDFSKKSSEPMVPSVQTPEKSSKKSPKSKEKSKEKLEK